MNIPELAIGDGAMGFWAALEEVYGITTDKSMRNLGQNCGQWNSSTRHAASDPIGGIRSSV
jgi:hypothetical protein